MAQAGRAAASEGQKVILAIPTGAIAMSLIRRTLAVAAVVLCGAAVASAQSPVRPGGNGIGVRPVTTVAPIPAMQMQQELAYRDAFRQAQLWQMYNPPVVIVNTNPWATPYVNINPFFNPNSTGALWQSNATFYHNTTPTWGAQPDLYRAWR